MLNMRKSTTLPSAPFHADTVLVLFVFSLNLPVNQQRPVLWKSKKAFGVEQKSQKDIKESWVADNADCHFNSN